MTNVTPIRPHYTLHCPQCNSQVIVVMASASWNARRQAFEIASVQEACHCLTCDAYSEKAVTKTNGLATSDE